MNCKSIRFNLIPDLGGHLNGVNFKNLNSLNCKKNEQDIHNNLNDEFNDDTSDYISSFENQEQHLFSYKLNLTKEDDDSTNLNSNRYHQKNLKLDLNYLKLDSFDRKIFSAQDERDAMQKKTFTKWINKYLNEIGNDINDLYEDLKDGTYLLLLLQILTKKTFTKERGNSKFHSLQNIRICLDYLKSNKLKLVNIHCEDIFYGNPKITLGLVWILISYFQISADGMQKDEMNAQQALLDWCHQNLKGYDSVRVKDFSSSWRDGKALIAILNRHRPDKISFNDSYLRSNLENLRTAFEFAENEFGVTKILDPEDVDTDHPDEKSIMTYVSMLFNSIPSIPMHPTEIQLESQKKQLMEEYSSICKSLMRWLRDSISTMDNRTVPKSLFEVKNLLNDIKNFRLEEYSIRLKEKKRLINLYHDMINLPDSESLNLDNELGSIEKVWSKFDNYIQLRENLLEKTYKKYEHLQTVITRIEKHNESCEKILNSLESGLNQASNDVLVNGHLKSFNDRLGEQMAKCDQEIRKMFADCQHLIDEEHFEADVFYKKTETIQNRSLELKAKISSYQQNFKNSIEIEIHREHSDYDSKINWLEKQKSILQEQNFPGEFSKIQSEIFKTQQLQSEINQFRESYLKNFDTVKDDKFKYCLNELEILYNFTFSLSNQRLKLLNQYNDFVKQINDEIFYLDQKEQIELNRDWSNPSKLESSSLKQYKKNLDYELERRLVINVNPIKLLAQTMLNEHHPAASHVKTYTDTLVEHFNWVTELSYLLSVHLSQLIDHENFKSEHKKLCDRVEELRSQLTDLISKSNHKNHEDSINKLDKMSMEIVSLNTKFDCWSNKSKTLTPFQLRRQKLNPPHNKCKFLVNYRRSQTNLNKNEECTVEDNSQKIKWKIRKAGSDQSIFVPSVCLAIPPPDEESLDLIQQLKIRIQSLDKQILSYRLQFKKDRLFNIMNKIKICDFDEYEERKKSADANTNFDLILNSVKYEIEELINQSTELNGKNGKNQHFIEFSNSDAKLLIDSYDACSKKLNEFNEKSAEKNQCQKFEKKFNSDLECLDLKLKYLAEKLTKIQQFELKNLNSSKLIDKVLCHYQDFESNDLKSFESELEKSFKKFESFEKSSSSHLVNTSQMRQQLDSMRTESENLRHNSNIYHQNLNLVKNLISLLEGSNVWITKLEERLCGQESMKNLGNLNAVLSRLERDLEDVASSAEQRQNEIKQIRDLTEKIKASKSNIASDILNLSEIIEIAAEIKKRFSNILSQIAERQVLLGDIQHSLDLYGKAYKTETKWINMLKSHKEQNQTIHKLNENIFQQTNMHDDITELKKTFDPVAQIYTELGTRSSQVDFLNETGIQLVSQLRKFSEILTDYREKTVHQALDLAAGPDTIVNQIRSEVNNLNREYSSLLKEYNQKVKTIVNSLSKSDKQFTVHITFDNAERLIEKYSQDQFARYDLIHSLSSSQNNYYYYDTSEKKPLNIDTIMEPRSQNSKLSAITFIDAVNRKQLDLETGMFKDPATNTFSLSLAQALHKNLLNGKSAHITEPHSLKSSDLLESVNTGLITSDNQVVLSANFTLSLADALKTGHLKIGEASAKNCSISSETQSMSIRSIRDPRSGEFLPPTEAIKRKLLDPYKGVFFNAANNEHMAISEAIQKGHVLVEANADGSVVESASRDHNVVSTSLIRETKSYHLLAVFDPSKNDEISIKEAIERGVLDRKRGLYVHPESGHTFSISDAINKGVIRARLLNHSSPSAPAQPSYQTLISTSRFEENRSYTITGAVDPRTGAHISLFQAIKDGIIDPKNGTYVNVVSGQAIPINKAIESKLVLTDTECAKPVPKTPPSLQIKTLNIEHVKDPRTARNISVSEAMQIGLLDKNTLHYNNPLTRQSLSLNRAYDQGLIIGHYSEPSGKSEASVQQSYFIVDIYDPRSNKSVDLDEAIRQRLFDHSRAVYVHPVTGQEMSIGEAVRNRLINAQIFEGDCEPRRFDARLPVAHFGIDKKIRSVRTKFNKDGTSVLQIDIESTKPVKGVYEVDEIEELTCSEPLDSAHEPAQRQVIDINSVHCVSEQQLQQPQEPVCNFVRDKNVVNIAINKEVGAHMFDSERVEDVVDDERPGLIRINVDKNNNNNGGKKIVERKNVVAVERSESVQPLVIDDSSWRQQTKLISIDGQRHGHKNEVQVGDGSATPRPTSELFSAAQQTVWQLDERLRSMQTEKNQQVKVKSAEIVDDYAKRQSSYFNIEPDDTANRQRRINVTVDIRTETKAQRVPVQEIYETNESKQNAGTKHLYEDTTIMDKIDVQPPPPSQVEDEDEEETFEEWTEVHTITIRGVRYKIIWVYDALKGENVTLAEAVKRGILHLKDGVYHNLKTSHSLTVNEAVDDGLIGIEQDNSAMTIKVNGITYTIYWVWDPVKRKRISPQRAIDRKVLDLNSNCYRNYSNNETISIHEAVYMKLIGASDDLTNIEQELTLNIDSAEYRICWVKDSRTGEKHKPREALRRGLLDLTNYFYNKYDTNQTLTIREAIRQGFVGLSDAKESQSECSSDSEFERQDSLSSLDDEELTIKTKTAIYVITGLVHPETQKEIKVSEAIKSGILNKENGFYKDFKTNVTYEVGEAINEGFVFATVTDLLQDETASTEFIREEVKKFIVKSVIDPRNKQRIGGLQAQAAGILNYAQGMYTDPDTGHTVSITEAINRNLIQVTLQEETCHEEFDAEVITETLMERTITVYRITGVLDPFTNQMISASDAVHRQIIDTETNSYVDGASNEQPVPIKEAVRRNLIQAHVTERIERKPLGVTLQNAIRLGLFNVETGKFKDLYTNKYFDLNQAVEKGHVNANGAAVAQSSTGSMTLNEAFKYSVFDKKTGVLDRTRLAMFNAKIVEAKIYKWNFEDAVKCGLVSLKNAKYKHQQTGELMSIKEAVKRGLIDGESVILDDVLTGAAMTLRQALDTKICIDNNGNVVDAATSAPIMSLEQAFNTRKIYSAFDENTGEIFLVSMGKLVAFEKAIRKNKMDKSIRVFDPRSNKDLSIGDALERCLIDKTSGMVIDPKGCGGLLSIKEAVKRGILSITGAPLVTGHHNSETIEAPVITSRKSRHILHNFDDINEPKAQHSHARHHKPKSEPKPVARTPIVYDSEYLNSDLISSNPGLVDRSAVTNVRLTNEEHRKRTSASGVKETLKADYKETVIRPGQVPVVTSSANYEKEFKSALDDDSAIKNLQTRFSVKSSDQDSFNRICKFVDDLIHGGELESATSIKKIINRSQMNKNLDPSDRDLINFLQFYKNKINKINDIDFISEVDLSTYDKE